MAIKIYNEGGSTTVDDGIEVVISSFFYNEGEDETISIVNADRPAEAWNEFYYDIQDKSGAQAGATLEDTLEYLAGLQTGGLSAPEGEGTFSYNDVSKWVDVRTFSNEALWTYSNNTTIEDPTSGFVRLDNTDFSLVTKAALSSNTLQGVSVAEILASLSDGSILSLREFDDFSKYIISEVNNVKDEGGWFSADVTVLESTSFSADGISTAIRPLKIEGQQNIQKRWNYTTEDSNTSFFSADTPKLFTLLNEGTNQMNFNIESGKANFDVANNWFDVSGVANNSTFSVRGEISGASSMEVSLMVRFIPNNSTPLVYFDKFTTNVNVRNGFLYELTFNGFLNHIDAIQIGALTNRDEILTISNIYFTLDEIV